MKNLIIGCVSVLLGIVFMAVIPTDAESGVYEDTLRLHILASSDTPEDQELKLKVRDAVLEKYADELSVIEGKVEAESKISELLPEIKCFCESFVKSCGYDYDVTVTLTDEWYETREYEDFSLPAGKYTSLRIIIGEGQGKNWWCVMFPPMCLDMALENAPPDDALKKYSDEEVKLISGGYNVKFKILELISEIAR